MEAAGWGLILQFTHVTQNIMILPNCIYFSDICILHNMILGHKYRNIILPYCLIYRYFSALKL